MKRIIRNGFLSVLMAALVIPSLLLAGCAASAPNTSASHTDAPLKVGMELAYPPFETKDARGVPAGVSVDFMKAFGESIGREVLIENTAWDGLIPSLQTGKVDMVMSSMTITDERKTVVDFSDPYANALLAILTNKNSTITRAEDLNKPGKKVAVKIGSTGHTYALEHLKDTEIIALTDESACVQEVIQGKADGFIYDQLTIYRNWQANQNTTTAVFIPFQNVEKWGIAVQKGNTELQAQLNAFIASYRAEGGFDRLTQAHLAQEKTAFDELGFQWFFDMQ
ncbi:MAG: transporter substrate-binding domain-containing protein [Raoultibacter sp.]